MLRTSTGKSDALINTWDNSSLKNWVMDVGTRAFTFPIAFVPRKVLLEDPLSLFWHYGFKYQPEPERIEIGKKRIH